MLARRSVRAHREVLTTKPLASNIIYVILLLKIEQIEVVRVWHTSRKLQWLQSAYRSIAWEKDLVRKSSWAQEMIAGRCLERPPPEVASTPLHVYWRVAAFLLVRWSLYAIAL